MIQKRHLAIIAYNHKYGTDVFCRMISLRQDAEASEMLCAQTEAIASIRQKMVDDFGEQEVENDETLYGEIDIVCVVGEGEAVIDASGATCFVSFRTDSGEEMSDAELAVRNKVMGSKECARCGGSLYEPYSGVKFCPKCEG